MFKRKDKNEDLSTIQILKNCVYCVKNVFKFSKLYFFSNIILQIFVQSVYAFESTYYMKYIVEAIQSETPFFMICIFIVIFCLLMLICDALEWFFFAYVQDIVWTKFQKHYNKQLFCVAGNADLSCFENPKFYNKYTMALDNTSNRIMQVYCNTIGIFSQIYRVLILFIAMVSIDKFVALFLVFPLIGNFVFSSKLNNLDQKIYKENTKNNRIIAYVMRTLHLQNFSKEMRLTDVYSLIQQKHTQAVDDYCENYEKHYKKRAFLHWIKCIFMFTLIFEGVLIYCAYRALISHTISLASLTVMSGVMVSATWGIINLCDSIMENHKECIYVQNARDFIAYKPDIPEDYDGIDTPEEISSIEFKNVSFGYKKDKLNLKNVSFKLQGKKIYAFVGCNGAGKTTVIKLLLRLYDPTSGEILLNGVNIKEYNLKQYRKLFAAAFQDYKVIADTVKNNILMGADIQNPDKEVERVLKAVDLYDKVKELKNGADTILTKEFDENGAVLSGGQYQKLACARAIAQNSPAMIFDEPSSALDPIAEYNLFDTIKAESKGKTMIFISHRLSSVKDADCVLMFDNGCLTEIGTHRELLSKNGTYAEMYLHQAKNYLAEEVTV